MKRIYYGWWVVFTCFVIGMYVGGTVFFGFTAFFEPIRREFSWSYTQISLAISIRGLEVGILAPLAGILVDRFGSRLLLLTGSIVVGAGLILLGKVQSLAMFYVAIMLVSFGAGGCTSVVTMTAVANWFHKNIGMALGVMASGYGASGLMVPVVVWLIDSYGWRTTVVILGLGMWIIGIPLALSISEKRRNTYNNAEEQASGELLKQSVQSTETKSVRFISALKNRNFRYLCLVEMMRMIAVGAVITHIMPYLSSLGMERTTAGFLAAAVPIVSISGRFGFGRLGDLIAKKYVMILTFTLMGLGLLVLIYAEFMIAAICFIVLFSPGFGGGVVMRGAILREYFGLIAFGRLLGIVLGAGSIGSIIGPTLAGWGFDKFNSYEPIWLFLTLFMAGAILLVMKIRR